MTPLVPAVGGALVVAGLIGVVAGLRPVPVTPASVSRSAGMSSGSVAAGLGRVRSRTWVLAVVGLAAGVAVAVVSGWLVAVVAVPAAVVGLPVLLASPPSQVPTLEALEEWTRSVATMLRAGAALEQALLVTVASAPPAIGPQVRGLAGRVRARWDTTAALRVFAEEIDDVAADLVVASLVLSAARRGGGLAASLEALAVSLAAEVAARRQVETDWAKPRGTARWITVITVVMVVALSVSGRYVAPYATPLGQVILLLLLAGYAAVLVWLRWMIRPRPVPRFLGAAAAARTGRVVRL